MLRLLAADWAPSVQGYGCIVTGDENNSKYGDKSMPLRLDILQARWQTCNWVAEMPKLACLASMNHSSLDPATVPRIWRRGQACSVTDVLLRKTTVLQLCCTCLDRPSPAATRPVWLRDVSQIHAHLQCKLSGSENPCVLYV